MVQEISISQKSNGEVESYRMSKEREKRRERNTAKKSGKGQKHPKRWRINAKKRSVKRKEVQNGKRERKEREPLVAGIEESREKSKQRVERSKKEVVELFCPFCLVAGERS